jgi:hypothetical protein
MAALGAGRPLFMGTKIHEAYCRQPAGLARRVLLVTTPLAVLYSRCELDFS